MNAKKEIGVFIVDDNRLFAMALKGVMEAAFEELRITVSCFETGEHCMEELAEKNPQLVILDYKLNSRSGTAADGLVILDQIKNHSQEISVIMLTSSEDLHIAVTSFHHGAADYVVKSERQFLKIVASITRILEKKEKARQQKQKEKLAFEEVIADKESRIYSREQEKRVKLERLTTDERLVHLRESERRDKEWKVISAEKGEMEKAKMMTEEKNRSMTDSINYARHIQQAKLPLKEKIYTALSECFILFKPKDIVSGDFYFFKEKEGKVFIAAADCTGHGVPGAFLSMIGSERLGLAISSHSDPSEILSELNRGFKYSLRQTDREDSSRDGMDIALCAVDKENCVIQFAGANRPLWIIRKDSNILEEIKGTKHGIGGLTRDDQSFLTHQVGLGKGDAFYIFSDGYADSFGGTDGKKLMKKRFKELLLGIQNLTMPGQEIYLDQFIEEWQAGTEQVDDILVIGVRF